MDPCPFCGGPDVDVDDVDVDRWAVICNDCMATGPISDVGPGDAETLWDARAHSLAAHPASFH